MGHYYYFARPGPGFTYSEPSGTCPHQLGEMAYRKLFNRVFNGFQSWFHHAFIEALFCTGQHYTYRLVVELMHFLIEKRFERISGSYQL